MPGTVNTYSSIGCLKLEKTPAAKGAGVCPELEHFPCCWGSQNSYAAAFSLRKAPMGFVELDHTRKENALATRRINSDKRDDEVQDEVGLEDGYGSTAAG